jgi:hypothetical protein
MSIVIKGALKSNGELSGAMRAVLGSEFLRYLFLQRAAR